MDKIKSYLKSAKVIRIKIESKQAEIIELRSKLGVHSPATDTVPSDSHSNNQSLILWVIQKEDELNNDILELVKERQKVIDFICQLDDPIDYQILHLRYIQEKSIKNVSKELGMDERTVRRRTNRACLKLIENVR